MWQFYIFEFQFASGLPSVSNFTQIESKEKRNKSAPDKIAALRGTDLVVRTSVMFSKLCLYTLASWFPEFLHHSTLFMLLEIQWKLCESLVYVFVPKVTQPHVCVFQMGNCNVNECGLLKHNVQMVAALLYAEAAFSNVAFLQWGLFFPCFVKYIVQVRLVFAQLNNSVRQWFSREKFVRVVKQPWNFIF